MTVYVTKDAMRYGIRVAEGEQNEGFPSWFNGTFVGESRPQTFVRYRNRSEWCVTLEEALVEARKYRDRVAGYRRNLLLRIEQTDFDDQGRVVHLPGYPPYTRGVNRGSRKCS